MKPSPRWLRAAYRAFSARRRQPPPRWLSAAHPEILRIDEKGVAQVHGSRQHASHFSTVFREHSRAITAAMAAHFKGNPHVIGWQTDNEFHCHFAQDHGPDAQRDFRAISCGRNTGMISLGSMPLGAPAFGARPTGIFSEIETPKKPPPHACQTPRRCWIITASSATERRAFNASKSRFLRTAKAQWWITHNGCFRLD